MGNANGTGAWPDVRSRDEEAIESDARHIVHWADGGETKLENVVLLCRSDHRRVHEGGYQVCSDRDGQVVFFTPRGNALFEAPPPLAELGTDPVEALVRGNRERGAALSDQKQIPDRDDMPIETGPFRENGRRIAFILTVRE